MGNKRQVGVPPQRQRCDSTTGQVDVYRAALGAYPVPPPLNVPKDAIVYWDGIMRTRKHQDWTIYDQALAAELSRVLLRLDQLSRLSVDEFTDELEVDTTPKAAKLTAKQRKALLESRELEAAAEKARSDGSPKRMAKAVALVGLATQLSARAMKIGQAIQIHALATQGKIDQARGTKKAIREASAKIRGTNLYDDDDLLPGLVN